MSEPTKIRHITKAELAARGAAALSDRPNTRHPYGKGGLSAKELKEWFDQLAALIADRHNELLDILASPAAADHIGVESGIEGVGTLADFFRAMKDGTLAAELAVTIESKPASLQSAIDDIVIRIGKVSDGAFTYATYDENTKEFVFKTGSGKETRVSAKMGNAVKANPEGKAAQTLKTLEIDGTIYNVADENALKIAEGAPEEKGLLIGQKGSALAEVITLGEGLKIENGKLLLNIPVYGGEVGEVSLITFYLTVHVGTDEYRATEGMSWGDWIESEYNTGGYTVMDGNVVCGDCGAEIMYGAEFVKATDTIIPDAFYSYNGG
jgi:hypothetical protein